MKNEQQETEARRALPIKSKSVLDIGGLFVARLNILGV